jgi:hypothetical protein
MSVSSIFKLWIKHDIVTAANQLFVLYLLSMARLVYFDVLPEIDDNFKWWILQEQSNAKNQLLFHVAMIVIIHVARYLESNESNYEEHHFNHKMQDIRREIDDIRRDVREVRRTTEAYNYKIEAIDDRVHNNERFIATLNTSKILPVLKRIAETNDTDSLEGETLERFGKRPRHARTEF